MDVKLDISKRKFLKNSLLGLAGLTISGLAYDEYFADPIMRPKPKQGEIFTDLHMHGTIGFQPYWLKVQEYEGRNLLKLIADKCFKRDIGLCAITSEEFYIQKDSVHDRFGYLVNEAKILPREYKVEKLDDIALVIEKDNKQVIIVNSQTVIVINPGKEEKIRLDHLVIGSNQVPNQMSLYDTLRYSQDNGLIQIAEHTYVREHFGLGEELLEKYLDYYNAIEIHNAQLFIPLLNRWANEKARRFALSHNKQGVANSDAHRIEDLGVAFTKLNFQPNLSNGEKFLESLKNAITLLDPKNPNTYNGYESIIGSWDYRAKFTYGIGNREKYGV